MTTFDATTRNWVKLSATAERYLEDSADQVSAGYITAEYALAHACQISLETRDLSGTIEFLAACDARPYD